jgi:hypothetical protein
MKDTINMAREAGADFYIDNTARVLAHWKFTAGQLKAFEALVRADEREACAKVAENLPPVGHYRQLERATLKDAASAIRARGNT